MKKIQLALMAFLLLMLFYSCRKSPDYDSLSSNFTVVTNRDTKIDFSNYKTFYISDTIAYSSSTSKDSFLIGPDAKTVVDAVKSNMAARGYTFIPKTQKPDLGINMGVIKDVYVGVIYPGWWYGYPGWWYPPYWGYGGWGYYYPYAIPYAVTTGNVIMDMVDLKNAPINHELKIIWNSFMGGGLSTTTSVNVQLTVDAINQSFVQSAYIKTK